MSNQHNESDGDGRPSPAIRHSFRKGSMLSAIDMPKNEFGQVVLKSDGPRQRAEQALRDTAKEMGVKSFEEALVNSAAIWDVVRKSAEENPDGGHDEVEGCDEYAEYNKGGSKGSRSVLDDLAAKLLDAEEQEEEPRSPFAKPAYSGPYTSPSNFTVPQKDENVGTAILANFCAYCGLKFTSGKFCSECGSKRLLIYPPE